MTETPSQEEGGDVVVMCSNGSNSCFKMQWQAVTYWHSWTIKTGGDFRAVKCVVPFEYRLNQNKEVRCTLVSRMFFYKNHRAVIVTDVFTVSLYIYIYIRPQSALNRRPPGADIPPPNSNTLWGTLKYPFYKLVNIIWGGD